MTWDLRNRQAASRRGAMRWMGAAAALLLAGGLVTTGCAKEGDAATAGKAASSRPAPVVPVSVARALAQDVPVQVQGIGTVEAYSTVTIKSRVPGQIVKVGFDRGQDVKKGDLLFEIDRRPFEATLAATRANLARDIALAKNAREEAVFQADIFKRSAGTQRELDKAAATAEAAEAQVEADKAAMQSAQVQLEYCTILSPLDGRTGDLMVHEGSVVKNDDTSLVGINQVSPVYVTFAAAEKYLPQIRRYMVASEKPLPVDVTIPQSEETVERGSLSFVNNEVDKTTGMIGLKGTFANQEHKLWPGQFVNVALTLTTRTGAVVVPTQAVQTGQAGQLVFVIKADQTAESRPVTAGDVWRGLAVIEKGNLQPGDTVVTDGQLRLLNGTKVNVK